ncbi:MAG: formyltransferase family protein [Acidimicrobiia bacterium]|nr:formyltransferase family protein [Acidimicrobiia bacterium]MDH3396211.1 formyltransferase family protein [Acidimicrobiia bacterium]MDH5616358.1 formyltransferase family protein [Acidimicrobiia bacterium]
MISTVFLGTPAASLPCLRVTSSSTDLHLVITRPDKPRGRSGRARSSPVKEAATRMGLPVAQPSSRKELEEILFEVAPIDVGVVVAFGMILPPAVLNIPSRGFVNIHFSLLPRWRGATPVEQAILSGDEETGVTLMVMDESLDTGPIVATATTSIEPTETAGELTGRLADLGAGLLSEHLTDYAEGRMAPVFQRTAGASYANRITTDQANVSARWPSDKFLRAVRAYSPRPGARFEDGALKVWAAAPTDLPPIEAGQLVFDGRRLYLGTADRPVELIEVQVAGGKRMSGAAWARGRQEDLGRLP